MQCDSKVSCEYASVDVHDVLGHHKINVTKNVGKYSVDHELKWTGKVLPTLKLLSQSPIICITRPVAIMARSHHSPQPSRPAAIAARWVC